MNDVFWFRPKARGYGAEPISWQGWALTAAFAGLLSGSGLCLALVFRPSAVWIWIAWLAAVTVLTVAFTRVAQRKTNGDWRWR